MTNIQWTNETWNPVTGCTKVSPGCKHCYAETVALRFWKTQFEPIEFQQYSPDICGYVTEKRYREFTDVQCHEDRLTQPFRWKKPRKVFVNSMSDLFHEAVPDNFIDRVFAVMALVPQHAFQVLTKRASRMREYMHRIATDLQSIDEAAVKMAGDVMGEVSILRKWPLSNAWLGVSVEDQQRADERIPHLLQTPAAVRFLSCEPLLGPVKLHESMFRCCHNEKCDESVFGIDWVILGGESGPQARPCDVNWIRSLIQQCRAAGVAPFVKQIGRRPFYGGVDCGYLNEHFGRRGIWSRDKKGGDINEWPEDLRVREYPVSGVPASAGE